MRTIIDYINENQLEDDALHIAAASSASWIAANDDSHKDTTDIIKKNDKPSKLAHTLDVVFRSILGGAAFASLGITSSFIALLVAVVVITIAMAFDFSDDISKKVLKENLNEGLIDNIGKAIIKKAMKIKALSEIIDGVKSMEGFDDAVKKHDIRKLASIAYQYIKDNVKEAEAKQIVASL